MTPFDLFIIILFIVVIFVVGVAIKMRIDFKRDEQEIAQREAQRSLRLDTSQSVRAQQRSNAAVSAALDRREARRIRMAEQFVVEYPDATNNELADHLGINSGLDAAGYALKAGYERERESGNAHWVKKEKFSFY